MPRLKRKVKKLGLTIAVLAILGIVLFPFYWTLISSFKPPNEIVSSNPTFIPSRFTIDNYRQVLGGAFLTFLKNSTLVSSYSMVISVILALPAAYSIARLRYRGRALISRSTLLLYLFPTVVLIVPIFNLASKLGLVDNHLSLVIINVALIVPFATWLLSAFFHGLPQELEEQAMVDGSTKIGALMRIILPLSAPGVATVALFAFITSWGEYLFAFLLMSSEAKKTITVGLSYWLSVYSISWGPLTASGILTIIPTLILFTFLGSFFVESLAAGALKE